MVLCITLGDIPWHGQLQPLGNALCRRVAQLSSCLADVGQTMPHITRPKVAVHRFRVLQMGIQRQQVFVKLGVEFIQRGTVAHCHVVNLVHCIGAGRGGSQQVGLDHVGNKAKVAAGFAVAVDVDGLVLDQAADPFGYDCGVGAIRILAWTKYVEVTQAHALQAVGLAKYVGVQLVDVFGDCVGAQRLANDVFDLGQCGVVAIGAAAGGIHKAFYRGIACSHQHVQKAADVGGIGGDGVCHAAGHAAQSCLVQNVVDALACPLAVA